MYQIMHIPPTSEDMTTSLSLTGITRLTTTSFKTRHQGAPLIVQKPIEGFILRKNDLLEKERLAAAKKPKRKKQILTTEPKPKQPRSKLYTINKRQITHRIRNMVNAMRGEKQLYFWTVSFPEKTPDDTAFICMNKWMTRLRKEGMLKTYLWITERQENGTIHFHLAINHRMCAKKANRYMRACLFTCIDNGEIVYTRDAAMKYNGVDIGKDRKTRRVTNFAKGRKARNLTNYLTKYVTKNQGVFPHLAWHCSRDYSNLIIAVRLTESEYIKAKIATLLNYEKIYLNEWFEFIPWKTKPPPEVERYLGHVNNIVINLINNPN